MFLSSVLRSHEFRSQSTLQVLEDLDVQRLQEPRAACWHKDQVNVRRSRGAHDFPRDVDWVAVQSEYYVNIAPKMTNRLRDGFEPHLYDVRTVVPCSQVPHF